MPTDALMQITCPRCDTSYGVDGATFPPEGRAVRCARCQEVWTATAEHPVPVEPVSADPGPSTADEPSPPLTDSPPISDDNPPNWTGEEQPGETAETVAVPARPTLLSRVKDLFRRKQPSPAKPVPKSSGSRKMSSGKLPGVVAGMAAMVAGLVFWRADVVRLLPQTAIAFKAVGLPVNLRGMAFQDMKVTTETVDGAPVMVIEGAIKSVAQKPVEIPRLRFIVRDERGNEIYAWNAVLEQAALRSGETLAFRSRLASPPPEARELEIRFFHRRDLARGAV